MGSGNKGRALTIAANNGQLANGPIETTGTSQGQPPPLLGQTEAVGQQGKAEIPRAEGKRARQPSVKRPPRAEQDARPRDPSGKFLTAPEPPPPGPQALVAPPPVLQDPPPPPQFPAQTTAPQGFQGVPPYQAPFPQQQMPQPYQQLPAPNMPPRGPQGLSPYPTTYPQQQVPYAGYGPGMPNRQMHQPIDNRPVLRVIGRFGPSIDPRTGQQSYRPGIDVQTQPGMQILSPLAGKAIVQQDPQAGLCIAVAGVIQAGPGQAVQVGVQFNGLQQGYCQNDQPVQRGQILAISGEVLSIVCAVNGQLADPLQVMDLSMWRIDHG